MKNINFKFKQNTNKNGLKGIYGASIGDSASGEYHIRAIAENGDVVAEESWSIMGNHYRAGERRFGDKLEKAGYDRMGY